MTAGRWLWMVAAASMILAVCGSGSGASKSTTGKQDPAVDGASGTETARGNAARREAAAAEYLAYVKAAASRFETAVGPFAAAVKAGDLAKVKALFAATRAPYESIEPIAESIAGLDPSIDARRGRRPEREVDGFPQDREGRVGGVDPRRHGPGG